MPHRLLLYRFVWMVERWPLAGSKPSEDEAKKVKAALTEWGCEGGTIEKESEATGVFEVDDAKCKGA